jgi:hypothetical protein
VEAKVEKKGKFEQEDDEKGEFGREGDDEGYNITNDDDYEVEHSWSKRKLRK